MEAALGWCVAVVAALAPCSGPVVAQEAAPASASPEPVVRAVLFFSPACPHCREVMQDHLPPLVARYGDRLRIAAVDVTTEGGQALYQATVLHFNLPRQRIGVPTLVVGSTVLVGSEEIPTMLPALVERGLSNGGVDWPRVALVREALAQVGSAAQGGTLNRASIGASTEALSEAPTDAPTAARTEAPTAAAEDGPAGAEEDGPAGTAGAVTTLEAAEHVGPGSSFVGERFLRDPAGNSASVATLLLLAAALAVGMAPVFGRVARLPSFPGWVTPVLALAGMGVAAYMAFVEVTGAEAVCGPVGDCNTVQQSDYARLFGVLPVGVLGLAGYAALLVAWVTGELARGPWKRMAPMVLWGVALVATLFSTYLTFLEPFVIGATCAWCLSSAVIAGLLLLATTAALPSRALPLRGAA